MNVRRTTLALAAFMTATLAHGAAGFDLQGHRGARGLAPENTLAAFRTALAIGVTTLETDAAVTSDGHVVLSHEPRLAAALTRARDGRWLAEDGVPIRALSLIEVQRYDVGRLNPEHAYGKSWTLQQPADGERIPTLSALFGMAKDAVTPGGLPVRFNIETKITPGAEVPTADVDTFVDALLQQINAANMRDRVTVQSFDWRTLRALRRRDNGIPTACLTIESDRFNTLRADASGASPWHDGLKLADHRGSLPKLVRAAGCAAWSPFWRNLNATDVLDARRLGLAVIPWTVNEPSDIERMLDLNVDGLITDYPDRAREILRRRGVAVD